MNYRMIIVNSAVNGSGRVVEACDGGWRRVCEEAG